jgi:hypothetical protein
MSATMAAKPPTGSSNSSPTDARPRAQVAYEGDDEFSVFSVEPERQEALEKHAKLHRPGTSDKVVVDELKSVTDGGFFGRFRKIFAK